MESKENIVQYTAQKLSEKVANEESQIDWDTLSPKSENDADDSGLGDNFWENTVVFNSKDTETHTPVESMDFTDSLMEKIRKQGIEIP